MGSPGQNSASPSSSAETAGGKSRAHANLRTFGRYAIEKKLGEGGMGAVYRAVDTTLNRTIALKVLPREKADNELLVKRFKAEAQAAARLRHRNIIGVYDAGEIDGYLYIAMEYVNGINVQDLVVRKGTLSTTRSLHIMKQVATALEHAWEQKIVHRDIKPANLLIDRDGVVRLADMGLARSIAETEEAGITRAGTTVGTVDYMSPEQARDSKSADCRSDIYSLGATWYHMLAGTPPFPGGDLLNKITAHATEPPPDPRDVRPKIAGSVVQIMHRMMAKDPADRYQTPTELLHDLEHGYARGQSGKSKGGDDRFGGSSEDTNGSADDSLVSLDVLAGLAEDDAEDAGGSNPDRVRSPQDSAAALAAAIFEDVEELPDTTDFQKPSSKKKSTRGNSKKSKTKDSGTVARPRPSGKKKTRKRNGAGKKPGSSADSVSADTMANGSTSSSIPSVREAMLARNLRRRRSAEERKQLLMLIAGFIAVCIIGYFVLSSLFSSTPAAP